MEEPEEVDEKDAPTNGVVLSLQMNVSQLPDGRYAIRAWWLDGPVIGETWPEAYEEAKRRRR